MLTVYLNKNGKFLLIGGGYIYGERLKKVGARYDYDHKVWFIKRVYINAFEKEFHGEVYYKTPLWVIKNEPAPDYSAMYQVSSDIKIPSLRLGLYNYQDFGARFMIDRILTHGFVINADGVGIGKTCQTIAVMQYLANRGVCHFLLIGKKSIKYQWAEEIRKFSSLGDSFSILCTSETKKKRIKVYEEAAQTKQCILITNYHNFLNDTELIKTFAPEFAVIDEAHCVKARTGKMNHNIAEVIYHVPTAFLTGTPVMSRPEDIFGIIQMADPNYFGDWDTFEKRYLVTSCKYGFYFTAGVKHLDELQQKIQDIVIRRTEYEVSVQMPKTTTHTVPIAQSNVQADIIATVLDTEQQYRNDFECFEAKKKTSVFTEDDQRSMKQVENAMKGLIAVKQIAATDPLIFRFAEKKSRTTKKYANMLPNKASISPKTEMILDIVDDIIANEEKVILFSKFVTTCQYYKEQLNSHLNGKKKKYKILMYTGLENDEAREKNKKDFCEKDECPILLGTDAMAEGLNLAEARHVINIDLPDTYAIYTQRIGRVRRVSSTYDNVIVHNILTKDSVDEIKWQKLKDNKELDAALISINEEQRKSLMMAQSQG